MHNSNTNEDAASTSSSSQYQPEKTEKDRPSKGKHRKRVLVCNTPHGALGTIRYGHSISNPRRLKVSPSELIFIYIIVTSAFLITFTSASTNYWPTQWSTRRLTGAPVTLLAGSPSSAEPTQYAQAASPSSIASVASAIQQANANNDQQRNRHQLMIGQHYNNFSSIVPYSIIQDQDYGSPQEDPLVEEQDGSEIFQQEQQQSQLQSPDSSRFTGFARTTDADTVRVINTLASGQSMSEHKLEGSQAALSSRALLPVGSNRLILPQMQQIKSRFNQGCVGGTKCQFFAFCWMSGGSLGASCGLLMTCCVTPSRQEIQPGFYGPVVNDPCKFRSSVAGLPG